MKRASKETMFFCFSFFALLGLVVTGEPSETACTAKCKDAGSIDKEAIQEVYENLDTLLFDKKDKLLDDLKDFLLDEEKHPSADYQEHFSRMQGRWDEDINSIDFNKVKEDSRTILQETEEWVSSLDLTSLREDGEKQVDYYRQYFEDYRNIKDDFIDGNLCDFLDNILGGIDLRSITSRKGLKHKKAEVKAQIEGIRKMTQGKKNKARFKALVNECKTRFRDIRDERQADYEELKEKYKTVHEDLKAKKRHWKELQKTWRKKKADAEDEDQENNE